MLLALILLPISVPMLDVLTVSLSVLVLVVLPSIWIQCVPICVNDKTGDRKDTECGGSKPICILDNGASWTMGKNRILTMVVMTCGLCINSESNDGTNKGYSDDTPLCVASDGTSVAPDTARGKCVEADECVNDKTGVGKDTGCTNSYPICILDDKTEPTFNYSGID